MSSNERDPALEKAWREHSRETPPPALDAAILAAAHRAVDSKPLAATSAPRWWMPLMAAAAVGVVAIGVIQLAPPPQPALDTTSSSVVASVEQKRTEPAPAPAQLQAPAPAAAPPVAPPMDAPKSVAEPEARLKKQKEAADRDDAGSVRASRERAAGKASVGTMVEERTPAPPPAAQESLPRENKVVAERRPEPFPASPPPQKNESTDDKRQGALGGRDAQGFAADAVTPGAKRDSFKDQAREDAPKERQLAAAAPPPPAVAPAPAAAAAARSEQPSRSMETDRPRAQVGGMLQKNAAVAAPPLESASDKARDPDAWIARIRKLRDEGQTAEALRELKEFRANVPDPEKRLPADLREWKP